MVVVGQSLAIAALSDCVGNNFPCLDFLLSFRNDARDIVFRARTSARYLAGDPAWLFGFRAITTIPWQDHAVEPDGSIRADTASPGAFRYDGAANPRYPSSNLDGRLDLCFPGSRSVEVLQRRILATKKKSLQTPAHI